MEGAADRGAAFCGVVWVPIIEPSRVSGTSTARPGAVAPPRERRGGGRSFGGLRPRVGAIAGTRESLA